MNTRLDALEARSFPFTGSHWIICEEDETREQACARYEAENGPMRDTDIAIIWLTI